MYVDWVHLFHTFSNIILPFYKFLKFLFFFRGYSNEDVLKLIAAAKAIGAISIDLSQKNLANLPQELYSLQEIEVIKMYKFAL